MVGYTSKDGIPIYPIDDIQSHVHNSQVKTAILTVPSVKAQEVADILVEAGIEGILSFSPVQLKLPSHVVVQYVDLTSELQTLLYFMNQDKEGL